MNLMLNIFLINFGKLFSHLSSCFNLGNGSTWPGHVALKMNSNFVRDMARHFNGKIILVAGTNGKTTTTKMLQTIFEENDKRVIQNPSGANLLNGIASGFIKAATRSGKIDGDYCVFEVDENALPLVLKQLTPDYLVLMNLFRDQLDRYGEINTISRKWKQSIEKLGDKTTCIVNADDPEMVYISKDTKAKTLFFGLEESTKKALDENTADSTYCPNCGEKLKYSKQYFSHIGVWECTHCKFNRPRPTLSDFDHYPLSGTYNKYNTLAAILVAKQETLSEIEIKRALNLFKPAFGRQEQLHMNNKGIQIFLSKNPTGFNESIKTIHDLNAKHILLILNDNSADGRDVSWIWDIRTEMLTDFAKTITVSGTRAYDMGLRIKYSLDKPHASNFKFQIEPEIEKAIEEGLKEVKHNETLYILPTYTAMLQARKVITGRSIL